MADRRRRIAFWIFTRALIFLAGAALGYYVRDQRGADLRQAYEQAVMELEELKRTGSDVIDRGRRAGEELRGGAEAAAESTRGAIEEVVGDTTP